MNDRTPPSIASWLEEAHCKLVGDIAAILDLDAGLREVRIPEQHVRVVADVQHAVDLEAGLTAITGTRPEPEPALDEPPLERSNRDPASLQARLEMRSDVIEIAETLSNFRDSLDTVDSIIRRTRAQFDRALGWVQKVNQFKERELRSDESDFPLEVVRAACEANQVLAGLEEGIILNLRDLKTALDRAAGLLAAARDKLAAASGNPGFDPALTAAVDASDEEALETGDFEIDWAGRDDPCVGLDAAISVLQAHVLRALKSVVADAKVAAVRDRGGFLVAVDNHVADCAPLVDVDRERAGQLIPIVELAAVNLSDVTGIDLREVDLARVQTHGLRWSDQTKWPKAWQVQIWQNSVSIGMGVYEVRGDAHVSHLV